MRRHKHHAIPKSRGGSNDPSNLVDLDPYAHALLHAEDFLYNEGPRFDFRHEAWPLLPDELRRKIRAKAAEHSSKVHKGRKRDFSEEQLERLREFQKLAVEANTGSERTPEAREKMRQARMRYLEEHGPYEPVPLSKETREKMSQAAKRVAASASDELIARREIGLQAGRKAQRERCKNGFIPEMSRVKWMCTVTGKVSTAGPLTCYQRARGIDPSNRIKLEEN